MRFQFAAQPRTTVSTNLPTARTNHRPLHRIRNRSGTRRLLARALGRADRLQCRNTEPGLAS